MTTAGEQLAEAARAFVGRPFRLHGRDPSTGLDCVGLVAASLAAIGRTAMAPRGYRLRNCDLRSWIGLAPVCGLAAISGKILAGDVLLTQPGPGQHHLMIASDGANVIHAHAGLRRIVLQPMDASLRLAAHWRLADAIDEDF